jgi:hypothetical protein
MTTPTDLHDLLNTEAGSTSGGPGWDDVVRRGRRRQRVRQAQRGVLAAVLVGAAITGVALSGGDPTVETTPPATDPPGPTTTLPYETTTSSTVIDPAVERPAVRAARAQGVFVTVIIPAADPTIGFDPCRDLHPRVVESDEQVGVELLDDTVERGVPWADCQSSPFSGWALIELTDPLGDRPLVDLPTDATVPVVDGASLLFPTELPEPFDIDRWDEFSPGTSWEFSWSASDLFATVTTGFAAGRDCERRPVEVRGTTGELCEAEQNLELAWEESGRRIVVALGTVDPDAELQLTVDDLLAIAEGLERLGG